MRKVTDKELDGILKEKGSTVVRKKTAPKPVAPKKDKTEYLSAAAFKITKELAESVESNSNAVAKLSEVVKGLAEAVVEMATEEKDEVEVKQPRVRMNIIRDNRGYMKHVDIEPR